MKTRKNKKLIIGISGASGAVYAQRLIDLLEQAGCDIHLIFTPTARAIFLQELHLTQLSSETILARPTDRLTLHDNNNLFSPLASGSVHHDAMVVCPCSSHSVAAIAAGLANTLLLRSAYVTLKQHHPLLLVHREMPLTQIDLENMLKISRAGGTICPACPPFYHRPDSIDDLVDAVVARVLDLIEVPHELPVRWNPTLNSPNA